MCGEECIGLYITIFFISIIEFLSRKFALFFNICSIVISLVNTFRKSRWTISKLFKHIIKNRQILSTFHYNYKETGVLTKRLQLSTKSIYCITFLILNLKTLTF
jgi:hypothetical protein